MYKIFISCALCPKMSEKEKVMLTCTRHFFQTLYVTYIQSAWLALDIFLSLYVWCALFPSLRLDFLFHEATQSLMLLTLIQTKTVPSQPFLAPMDL